MVQSNAPVNGENPATSALCVRLKNLERAMKLNECTISVSMTKQERNIIETLSKRSKGDQSEMIRILLFETGILQNKKTS